MPTFDTGLISRIQQANDIVDVVGEHLALKHKGREMVGLCPFHDDHRPSFNVNPGKQIFICFACGAGGDVVKFIQIREGLTFPQALQRLASRAGIKIDTRPKTQDARPNTQDEVDPNELARVNAWAAKYFAANLAHPEKGEEARKYVAERKLSAQSVKDWQIGLAIGTDNDLLASAMRNKIPDRLLITAGLAVGSGLTLADKFVNRLMFSIADVTGRIIAFGGRTLTNDPAKYINSPTTALFDKSNALFGLDHARHQIGASDTAIVVEGYTDTIMAHQFGVTNVVATLGTSFTAGHARILRRYAKKVVLLFDSDVAGITAANRALGVALGSRIDIAVASVPEGKDPCDFLLAQGKEPFDRLIENAPDVFTFKWQRLNTDLGTEQTIAGKKQAVEEYLDAVATAFISGNLSAIERGFMLNRLSSIMKLDAREINGELKRRIERTRTSSSYSNTPESGLGEGANLNGIEGLSANTQREILEVLLAEPKLFADVEKVISPQSFDNPIMQRIAEVLFRTLSANASATILDICASVEEPEIAGLITALEQTGTEKGNFQKRLDDAVKVMQQLEGQKKGGGKSDLLRRADGQANRSVGMV